MGNSIHRNTMNKELRLANGYVKTREAYEALGVTFIGTVGQAASQGYFMPAGCERKQLPVTADEFKHITHVAMLANCYADQCIVDETGAKRRPCLPVFYREITE